MSPQFRGHFAPLAIVRMLTPNKTVSVIHTQNHKLYLCCGIVVEYSTVPLPVNSTSVISNRLLDTIMPPKERPR